MLIVKYEFFLILRRVGIGILFLILVVFVFGFFGFFFVFGYLDFGVSVYLGSVDIEEFYFILGFVVFDIFVLLYEGLGFGFFFKIIEFLIDDLF